MFIFLALSVAMLLLGLPEEAHAITLKLTLLTWNTEYYWPKNGDFNALIKANDMTSTQVCDSDAVTVTLQEVKSGYVSYIRKGVMNTLGVEKGNGYTSGTYPDSREYTKFKNEFTEFLEHTCDWKNAIPKQEDFHGLGGTKWKSGINSQISISFARENIEVEHSHISTCPTSKPSEKGGMLIKITKDDMKALVVGVHLDSESNQFRSEQICRILKFAVEEDGSRIFDEEKVHGVHKCADLDFVPKELKEPLLEKYKLGVYWLGDSNYRLPVETFGLTIYQKSKTAQMLRSIKMKLVGKKGPNKEKVVNRLAEIGNPGAKNEEGEDDQDAVDHKAAVTKLRENDVKSLEDSLLWVLGATVNQPYPNFPPSYPFDKMQPHELKLRLEKKSIPGEDEENILARDLVNNWMVGKPAPDEGAIHQKYKKLQISKIQVLTTTTERVGTPDAEYTGHKEFGTKDDKTIDDDAISQQEHAALLTVVSKDLHEEEKRKFNLIRQRKRLEAKVPRIARVFGGDDEDDEDDESISQQELKRSIEAVFTLTKKEVMKVKGEGTATALNIGYLDRLFIIAPPETVVSRDLEVQAVIYGGDHLPQLFHITAVSATQSRNRAHSLRANQGINPVMRDNVNDKDLVNFGDLEMKEEEVEETPPTNRPRYPSYPSEVDSEDEAEEIDDSGNDSGNDFETKETVLIEQNPNH